MKQAARDGCKTILGRTVACNYAGALGIFNMHIKTLRESFWQSLTEAKWISYVTRANRKKVNG
jgi:hypothetical protein